MLLGILAIAPLHALDKFEFPELKDFTPNTYHPDGSTVEGGYGCFGSVAVSVYEL